MYCSTLQTLNKTIKYTGNGGFANGLRWPQMKGIDTEKIWKKLSILTGIFDSPSELNIHYSS